VFESGKIKARGIKAVRPDTPPLIKSTQMDMIRVLAKAPQLRGVHKEDSEGVAAKQLMKEV